MPLGQLQRLLEARGLLDQLLVADLDRSRNPSEDRDERGAENEDRDSEEARDRIERLASLGGDSDVVVLVELEDPNRTPAKRFDREICLENFDPASFQVDLVDMAYALPVQDRFRAPVVRGEACCRSGPGSSSK